MTPLLSLMIYAIWPAVAQVPAGAELHIRLTKTVGSYSSKPGAPVSAVLVEPVILNGGIALPAGSTLSGTVKTVTRVGFGVRHEAAELGLEFSQLTLPRGRTVPISARVAEVDNGREHVTQDGRIQGVRATNSLCYRLSGYLRTLLRWEIHAEIATWAIRSLVVQVPEPELYYPAGSEFTLRLLHPALSSPIFVPASPPLGGDERAELERLTAALPDRTRIPEGGRPADPTNVLLLGSRDEIATAFAAAGWSEARPASLRAKFRLIRAVTERRAFRTAPMSSLLLDNAEADMSWEKGSDYVAKRHHIRLWRQQMTWHGRQVWIGAATRDVAFAYLRRGAALTHKIESDIDRERDKVAYDLVFTSCANILAWTDRPGLSRFTRNATGDPISTDARLAVVDVEDCPEPRLATESEDLAFVPEHGSLSQRFARREILVARNDLIRGNPYWRTFEIVRALVDLAHDREKRSSGAEGYVQPSPQPGLLRAAFLRVTPMQ